ncbi:MAG: hypothetical protein IT317_17180 [Anaerolineales bacterium]|nr:hypothetical protein [Anaerolineales bacterium]
MPERPAAQRWAAAMLSDIAAFSYLAVGRPLYGYQLAPARAILDSVLHRRGREFAVLFPRQAGKNETQAQVEAYLLTLFQRVPGASIVRAQPTFRPQALNARLRLERTLNAPRLRQALAGAPPRRRFDYLLQVREAQVFFYSAAPSANVVGATATLLLHCDEAQDVRAAEWARKFVPMGASTNVTVAYWGTAWTARTLLAETIRRLQAQEAADGLRRVFLVSPEQVAAENPAYGAFVARQVAQLGRDHPLVRTQFFNEALEAEAGLFPPARRALMQGAHAPQPAPQPGADYAFLLDVAGEDGEAPPGAALGTGGALGGASLKRDATALTIVQVEPDAAAAGPVYLAVQRRVWVGVGQPELLAALRALAAEWQPRRLVVDATGLGAGLAGFLARALPPGVVVPVDFNSATKSRLGWQFLAVCDTGRWQEWRPGDDAAQDALQTTFWRQAEACAYTVRPGPGRVLAWGVPDNTRDAATGELIHDDLLLSAALGAVLDEQPWPAATGPGVILRAADPLAAMSRGF